MAKNAAWREPDCSKKTCPRGTSHNRLPPYVTKRVYAHAVNAECSDRGTCDGDSGECLCLPGYTGAACQYSYCSEAATANGVCQSNLNFALDATYGRMAAAGVTNIESKTSVDVSTTSIETDAEFMTPLLVQYSDAWDSGLMFGMKCDDGHRGPLCNILECPSGADPLGFEGSTAGRDCSGRGICDTTSGTCVCFDDFTGTDCSQISATM